jgi:hypothetical protein
MDGTSTRQSAWISLLAFFILSMAVAAVLAVTPYTSAAVEQREVQQVVTLNPVQVGTLNPALVGTISQNIAPLVVIATATPTRTPTPINLGNFVWDDLDQDGRQDAGEPGLSGVTVQVWNPNKTILYGSDVTDANGNYTVVAPLPGDYRVRVVLLSAMDSFSPKDQAGGDDTDDSDINPTGPNTGFTDVISIASNVISITSIDIGIIKFRTATPTRTPTPINLGNFVWNDLDDDGIQDPGEAGIPGVTVQLWNAAKTQLFDDAVTNASGNYTVVAPLPGDYRIRVILPSAADDFSPKNQGGDNTDDSDVNPNGVHAGFTDVISIASNVISISSIDIGIMRGLTINPALVATLPFSILATPTPFVNLLPVATPTFTLPAPPPPITINCGAFRLTAPLDGLPNGAATFFWDPLPLADVTYQITIFDENGRALTSVGAGNGFSFSLDVSQGAIGGLFQLTVRIDALRGGQIVCSDTRMILRASTGGAPPAPPTPTPRRRGN